MKSRWTAKTRDQTSVKNREKEKNHGGGRVGKEPEMLAEGCKPSAFVGWPDHVTVCLQHVDQSAAPWLTQHMTQLQEGCG